MKRKITIATLASLLLFSGCGDDKSTGERMAESVAKIRGDAPKEVKPEVSTPTIEEKAEEVNTEENTSISERAQEIKSSLQEVAKQASDEIKALSEPANEALESAKDVASVTAQSLKEAAQETKEALTDAVTPAVDKAKKEMDEGLSKLKALVTPDKE